MKRSTLRACGMCKLLVVFGLALGGCAGRIVKVCPGGTRLVTIDESKIDNAYLARVSEEARAMAKCAKLDVEGKLEDAKGDSDD